MDPMRTVNKIPITSSADALSLEQLSYSQLELLNKNTTTMGVINSWTVNKKREGLGFLGSIPSPPQS